MWKVESYCDGATDLNLETSEDSAGDGLADSLVDLEHIDDSERG